MRLALALAAISLCAMPGESACDTKVPGAADIVQATLRLDVGDAEGRIPEDSLQIQLFIEPDGSVWYRAKRLSEEAQARMFRSVKRLTKPMLITLVVSNAEETPFSVLSRSVESLRSLAQENLKSPEVCHFIVR